MLQIGSTYPGSGNFFASAKSFGQRGGFVNGLQPTLVGRTWYVLGNSVTTLGPLGTVVGSDSNNGLSPVTPLLTMARALALCDSYDIIVLMGVIREQVVTPVGVYDVTVVGASNQPRQATNNGVYTGGGASWLAPSSPAATTPLVRVVEQSWKFINLQMAPVAASACITFDRRETAAIPDASHGSVDGCYFSTGGSGGFGVEIIECKKIFIKNSTFEALTGAGGLAINTTAGDGIANPSYCEIIGNKFASNTGDMDLVGMEKGLIANNNLYTTNTVLAGIRIKLTTSGGSGRNHVLDNNFADVAADVSIANGYVPGTDDVWRNWTSNTNVPIVTVPS